MPKQTGREYTALAALVFLVTIAAYVVLEVKGRNTAGLIALVTPVLASIYVVARVERRTDAQDITLAKIAEQTNGVLDKRIRESVSDALAIAQVTPAQKPAPPPTEPPSWATMPADWPPGD